MRSDCDLTSELKAKLRDALEAARCKCCEFRNNAKRSGAPYSDISETILKIDEALEAIEDERSTTKSP